MEPPVITGLGAVSPFGRGAAALWAGLKAGRPAWGPIKRFPVQDYRCAQGGEAPADAAPAGPGRLEAMALAAAREALEQAGLAGESAAVGLVGGTNFGGAAAWDGTAGSAFEFRRAADALARELELGGPRRVLSLSCAAGLAAVAAAAQLIARGDAPALLAGGWDELTPLSFSGLNAIRATTPDVIRPFDRRRNGTIFSEGAGFFLLEDAARARARGAAVLARLAGAATSNDAFHLTAPEKSGRGIAQVIGSALAAAGAGPAAVDHVNTHGTGTLYNDPTETAAIRRVLGERARAIPLVSLKGALGHAQGAAGILEAIAAVFTINESLVPPTVGLEEAGEGCDLDYVPGRARPGTYRTVLATSYGIGGCNAAAVLAAAD